MKTNGTAIGPTIHQPQMQRFAMERVELKAIIERGISKGKSFDTALGEAIAQTGNILLFRLPEGSLQPDSEKAAFIQLVNAERTEICCLTVTDEKVEILSSNDDGISPPTLAVACSFAALLGPLQSRRKFNFKTH